MTRLRSPSSQPGEGDLFFLLEDFKDRDRFEGLDDPGAHRIRSLIDEAHPKLERLLASKGEPQEPH